MLDDRQTNVESLTAYGFRIVFHLLCFKLNFYQKEKFHNKLLL